MNLSEGKVVIVIPSRSSAYSCCEIFAKAVQTNLLKNNMIWTSEGEIFEFIGQFVQSLQP